MITTVDISNLDKENHSYAIHLATYQNILTYKNGSFMLAAVSKKDPFEAVDFWRNISLATEVLLKASLLKQHIPFLGKEPMVNMVKRSQHPIINGYQKYSRL